MTDDPYVDPATGALINLLDLADAEALASSEAQYVALGLHEFDQRPLPGDDDVAHLRRSTGICSATSTRGLATSER